MPQRLNNNLSIGLRYYTNEEQNLNATNLIYYLEHLKTFKPKNIFLVTLENDPIVNRLQNSGVKIFTLKKDEWNFSKPVSILLEAANDTHLLMISVGVELLYWQLMHGFEFLRAYNLFGIGWRILQQENDGSFIGRLAYHTCLLYEPGFYTLFKKVGGIPGYVENGVAGSIIIRDKEKLKELPIGGQEDLALQLRIYKRLVGKKSKLFGHIKHYGLNFTTKAGTGLTNKGKIMRKLMVADVFRHLEEVDPTDFMDSWVII